MHAEPLPEDPGFADLVEANLDLALRIGKLAAEREPEGGDLPLGLVAVADRRHAARGE